MRREITLLLLSFSCCYFCYYTSFPALTSATTVFSAATSATTQFFLLLLLLPHSFSCSYFCCQVHDITEPGYRQLIVNTLGINLWGDWEYPVGEQDRWDPSPPSSCFHDSFLLVFLRLVSRAEDGDRRQLSLDKLSEMERRMGLKEETGRRGGAKW